MNKIIICISCIILVSACTKKPDNNQMQTSNNAVVTVTYPKYESYPVVISANGLIQPLHEVVISAEVGGLDISHVYVNVGDVVKKGQLLAELNAAQINADVLNQKANVAEANASFVQANIEAIQARELEKSGALSSQELLQYSTNRKTTQAKLSAANASLSLQKLKLSYTKITAPDAGIISSRSANVGAIANDGGELFRLISGNQLEWQAEISLDYLESIKSGQQVTLENSEGQQIHGVVRQISPTLSSNNKSGIVYVDIANNVNLKVGTSIAGSINTGIHNGLLIPFKSVISSDGFNYVMTVNIKNEIHKAKIKLGNIVGDNVLVVSGISNHEKIVLDGASFLNESDVVSIAKE